MEIKWPNVVAFGLLILAAGLAVRHGPNVGVALTAIGDIGPGHTPEEKFIGFAVLGVILVCLVALVRLVLDNHKGDDR